MWTQLKLIFHRFLELCTLELSQLIFLPSGSFCQNFISWLLYSASCIFIFGGEFIFIRAGEFNKCRLFNHCNQLLWHWSWIGLGFWVLVCFSWKVDEMRVFFFVGKISFVFGCDWSRYVSVEAEVELDGKGGKSLALKNGFYLFSTFCVLVNFFWKWLIFLLIDNANLWYPFSIRCNLSL